MSQQQFTVGDPAPPPLQAPPEQEILANWGDGREPLVSIICATYQHAPFIANALHGFLAQITDFPIEVLVRDDASTDGTAQIVAKIAQEYPQIIHAVLEPENQWPQQQAAFILQPLARGKFLAFCEGDDYWTDAHHLQTLVDALIRDTEASAVFSPAVYIRDGKAVDWYQYEGDLSDRLAIPHFPGIPLGSLCVRNLPVTKPAMLDRIISLDRYHLSVWAKAGPLRLVAHAAPSVYRLHDRGTWSPRSTLDSATSVAESYAWIASWWRDQGDPELAREFERAALKRLNSALPDAQMIVRARYFPSRRDVMQRSAQYLRERWPELHTSLKRVVEWRRP